MFDIINWDIIVSKKMHPTIFDIINLFLGRSLSPFSLKKVMSQVSGLKAAQVEELSSLRTAQLEDKRQPLIYFRLI